MPVLGTLHKSVDGPPRSDVPVPDNNRKTPRTRIDLPIQIEVDGRAMPALAVNVGLGGMFIEGPPLEYGQRIEIVAELPGLAGPVKIPAVVRWAKDHGIGVQFLQLGARVTHALSQIVSDSSAA
jgi:hypothetical protein